MDLELIGGIYIVAVAIVIVGCIILITWDPEIFSKKSKR